jgi:dTDP-4-dehydrorhamnose reductase
MKYMILGSTGMAGHIISIYLSEMGHEVVSLSRKPFRYCKNILCDVSDLRKFMDVVSSGNFDVIVNCLGILNQEADSNKSKAVFINSYIPHILEEVTNEMKTKIIHLSTDCVFSGDRGNYKEDDFKDGRTFYDRTKALGEVVNNKDLTFRNSIVGPDLNIDGIGLFNWFMKQSGDIKGYRNAIWTGVTTLHLAKAIEQAATHKLSGLYHLVNNNKITKFDILCLFKKYFNRESVNIIPFDNVSIDKSLVNTRTDFAFGIPDYEEMIYAMSLWVYAHKEMYIHYFA